MLSVLQIVLDLVPGILALVGKVLLKVEGLVDIIRALVALDLGVVASIVSYLQIPL